VPSTVAAPVSTTASQNPSVGRRILKTMRGARHTRVVHDHLARAGKGLRRCGHRIDVKRQATTLVTRATPRTSRA
jgi:hypothetical protein